MGPLVRLMAVLASAVVALSLVLFVIDQSSDSSRQQVQRVDSDGGSATADDVNVAAPSGTDERLRERSNSSMREAIDDANDVLVTPFAGITGGNSVWASRLVSAALALLLYGLGGLLLANFFSAPPREHHDWRETAT